MRSPPNPGTRVRLTGAFLRATGQHCGDEPRKRWVVQSCDCALCMSGRFVALDEQSVDGDGQRHVAIANLEPIGGKP